MVDVTSKGIFTVLVESDISKANLVREVLLIKAEEVRVFLVAQW